MADDGPQSGPRNLADLVGQDGAGDEPRGGHVHAPGALRQHVRNVGPAGLRVPPAVLIGLADKYRQESAPKRRNTIEGFGVSPACTHPSASIARSDRSS